MERRRRDGIDVARVLALLVVVMGHLLLAVIDRSEGALRGANLVALHPGWAWLTALAPMPVFFAAGGWANATTTSITGTPRVRALVGLGAVVVVSWSALVLAAAAATGDFDAGVVGDGARIATQPLWFLAAYAPMALVGAPLAQAAARHGALLIAGALGALVVLDVARFGLGVPEWIGWPGFFLAWGVPWVAGGWWRARVERPGPNGFPERRTGIVIATAAAAGCALLVARFGYEPALIDAVPGARSNTTPPTLFTAVAGIAQVGVLLAATGLLDRAGRRWRGLLDRAGDAAVGVYAWHLTALALCAAVIAAGLPVPERLTTLWWATRPLWWVSVLGVTAVLVALTAWTRSTFPDLPATPAVPSMARITAGAVVTVAAGGIVGLEGPKTVPLALACSALFVGAWSLLRTGHLAAPNGRA